MECNDLLREAIEILGKDKVTTTDFVMPESSALSLKRRLAQEESGEYSSLYRMSPEVKQDVVNHLFSSRSMEAKGLTSNQSSMDVDYSGQRLR